MRRALPLILALVALPVHAAPALESCKAAEAALTFMTMARVQGDAWRLRPKAALAIGLDRWNTKGLQSMAWNSEAGETPKPPTLKLLRAFLKAPLQPALACPGVATLTDGRVSDEPPARKDPGHYTFTILELSRPMVSADGREAVVYASSTVGPLAASGGLLLLRRADAHTPWKVVASRTLWVS